MRHKIRYALLKQRDPSYRRRLAIIYGFSLVVFFVLFRLSWGWDSPLNLIPVTFTGVSMGYILTTLITLRQFSYLADYIDWDKVIQEGEQDDR